MKKIILEIRKQDKFRDLAKSCGWERNEKTSPIVASKSARILQMCSTPPDDITPLWKDILSISASALTQAADKKTVLNPRTFNAVSRAGRKC